MKYLGWLFSVILIGLLAVSSLFNVGWALAVVQVVYWVLYAVGFVAISLCLLAIAGGDDDVGERLVDSHRWWHWITFIATTGLMFYGGLFALPIVSIIMRLYILGVIYMAEEILKNE